MSSLVVDFQNYACDSRGSGAQVFYENINIPQDQCKSMCLSNSNCKQALSVQNVSGGGYNLCSLFSTECPKIDRAYPTAVMFKKVDDSLSNEKQAELNEQRIALLKQQL